MGVHTGFYIKDETHAAAEYAAATENEMRGLYKLAVSRADVMSLASEAVALLKDPVIYRFLSIRDRTRADELHGRLDELCGSGS